MALDETPKLAGWNVLSISKRKRSRHSLMLQAILTTFATPLALALA